MTTLAYRTFLLQLLLFARYPDNVPSIAVRGIIYADVLAIC